MRILPILMLSVVLISLNACSSMSGNVVPQSGPSMEKVYDGMNKQKNDIKKQDDALNNDDCFVSQNEEALKNFRDSQTKAKQISLNISEFHRIPNPELHMYIYPHLSGQDQVPVPGYFTVFNSYEKSYYTLSNV